MNSRNSFGKGEKLKSRKRIDLLFKEGKRVSVYPVMIIYRVYKDPARQGMFTGVSVRAKQFRHAVDRNRIKRMLREAYRLQKNDLLEHATTAADCIDLFILYNGKEIPAYSELYARTGDALKKIEVLYAKG